jgi:hypothetical protein
MRNNQNDLLWEMRQENGNGTGLPKWDGNLVKILEGIMPFDLDQMVSEKEAIPVPGGGYVLTKKGYNKFVQAAEQRGNSEIVKLLHDNEGYYWFRDA